MTAVLAFPFFNSRQTGTLAELLTGMPRGAAIPCPADRTVPLLRRAVFLSLRPLPPGRHLTLAGWRAGKRPFFRLAIKPP
jgi:hypothetical protein